MLLVELEFEPTLPPLRCGPFCVVLLPVRVLFVNPRGALVRAGVGNLQHRGLVRRPDITNIRISLGKYPLVLTAKQGVAEVFLTPSLRCLAPALVPHGRAPAEYRNAP